MKRQAEAEAETACGITHQASDALHYQKRAWLRERWPLTQPQAQAFFPGRNALLPRSFVMMLSDFPTTAQK
jgi:hypothetical protein